MLRFCRVDGVGPSTGSAINGYCDYGQCVSYSPWSNQCVHHSDCPKPMVCDLGYRVNDGYVPCP